MLNTPTCSRCHRAVELIPRYQKAGPPHWVMYDPGLGEMHAFTCPARNADLTALAASVESEAAFYASQGQQPPKLEAKPLHRPTPKPLKPASIRRTVETL